MAAAARRPSTVALATTCLLLVVGLPATASGATAIVPIGPDPTIGCVFDGPNDTRLTAKGPRGRNLSPSYAAVAARVDRQRRAALRRARALPPGSRRRAARRRAARLYRMLAGVQRCLRATLDPPARSRRTFAFYCLHGTTMPAVMRGGACGVDARRDPAASALALLDDVLATECEQDGGVLSVPRDREAFSPLYWAHCTSAAASPTAPFGFPGRLAEALGIEAETDNCLLPERRDVDPCANPPRDPHPAPSADPPPQAPRSDCAAVLRMESEFCDE